MTECEECVRLEEWEKRIAISASFSSEGRASNLMALGAAERKHADCPYRKVRDEQ